MLGGRRRRRLVAIVGPVVVAVVITGLSAAGLSAGAFSGFRRQAADALFPSTTLDKNIVVVGIDSPSLQNVGKVWPWPRDVHAQLVRNLGAAGARLVVYDVLFAPGTPADAELAAALKTTPVVLAAVGTEPTPTDSGPFRFGGLTPPMPELAAAAAGVAHANVSSDPADGVVRSVPLVVEDAESRFVPGLARDAFRVLNQVPDEVVVRPHAVQVGDRLIPTDRHKALRVNYPEGLTLGGANYLSAIDVIRGEFPDRRVKGKTVFVGATDLGLGDNRLVPVDKGDGVPGVFVHASALHTMQTRTYIADVARWQTLLFILLLAYLVAVLSRSVRLWIATIATIVIGVAWLFFVFVQFDAGHVHDLVYPFLAIALAFLVGVVLRYLTEGRRRRRVTTLFSQYVPGEVALQLCNDDRLEEAIAGQRIEATVLFLDLRGFTAMSEHLEPTEVRAVCEVYYEDLTNIVYRHGGTLLAYVGDAIFAVFGAPLSQEGHAAAGLRAALEMRDSAPAIRRELEERDLPWLDYGIGLNTGDVVAACVGGTRRRQYTVLGDTVNISSRLCSLAGAAEIILPEQTRSQVPEDELPPLERVEGVALKNVSRERVLWRATAPAEQPAGVGATKGNQE